MTRYFLHRVPQEQTEEDYFSAAASTALPGDIFIIYQAHTHLILSINKLNQNNELEELASGNGKTMKELLPKMSFVHEVNENTLRMLKKKNREIEKVDADLIANAIGYSL
jgi:hypothetical protein